jgi:glycosyltransferase involved in cell wall biosynthesis
VKLLLVTHYYPAHRGGIERVAAELASRLARTGAADITWWASNCDQPPQIPGVRCEPGASSNAIERRFEFPYPIWSPAALARLVRAVRSADVVHFHDCLYLPNLVAYVAARMARRPVLVTQHVGWVPYRSVLLRLLLITANRLLGALVLGGATQVVFVSEAVRRYFERFVRFRNQPLLIANGVDTSTFSPASEARRETLRTDLGLARDQLLLLFVGRFVEKKGLHVLRELVERFPRALWAFAGWGPLDPTAWNRPNVRVVGGRGSAELVPLYQAADLLVLPSVGEGFPLVVQEAMACGTPVLIGTETAAGCPGAGELLLAEPMDGADVAVRWSRRIDRLLDAPERLHAMRPRVAEYARENWSWDRSAQRYAETISRCVGQ